MIKKSNYKSGKKYRLHTVQNQEHSENTNLGQDKCGAAMQSVSGPWAEYNCKK